MSLPISLPPQPPAPATSQAAGPVAWSAQAPRFPRPDPQPVLAALNLLYGELSGYAELGYIDGDPRTAGMQAPHDSRRSQRFVYTTPARRSELAEFYCDLVERFGNVYISAGLYTRRRRSEQYLVGLRVLFLDDAIAAEPAALPIQPALILQTSPASQQWLFQLREPVTAERYRRLVNALLDIIPAGRNSVNPQHLIRLPGAINTKPCYGSAYGAWPRRFAPDVYADLDSIDVGDVPVSTAEAAAYAEVWRATERIDPGELRPGGPFRNNQGELRRLKPDHYINQVLTGRREWGDRADGRDSSYSGWRYNLMLAAWLHHYPLAEIVFLAMQLAADDAGRKSLQWLRKDIERILGKLALSHPRDEPACQSSYGLCGDRSQRAPPCKLPRGGRPLSTDERVNKIVRFLKRQTPDAWGRIVISINTLAARLRLGRRMVQSYLKLMRERGLIATGQIGGNGKYYIVLQPASPGAGECSSTRAYSSQGLATSPPIEHPERVSAADDARGLAENQAEPAPSGAGDAENPVPEQDAIDPAASASQCAIAPSGSRMDSTPPCPAAGVAARYRRWRGSSARGPP